MAFKIGDKVQVKNSSDIFSVHSTVPDKGTVFAVDGESVDVIFDDWCGGHDGDANDGSVNHYYVDSRHVESIDPIATSVLPVEAHARKNIPLASGVLDYFPSALIEVAKVSKAGNDQHNPGEPLHWAQDKSTDHADTLMRHFVERGTVDTDGQRHSAKLAWRALALLQMELQNEGYPKARGAK